MWRLLYCKRKLAARERQVLIMPVEHRCKTWSLVISLLMFMPGRVGSMNQSKNCNSVLKSQLICIHCAAEGGLEEKDGSYPQCANCSDKEIYH